MQTRWTQARLIEELDFVRSFFILESSYQADSNLPILHAIRKGPWQTLATVMTIGWFVGHRLATPSKRIIINGLQNRSTKSHLIRSLVRSVGSPLVSAMGFIAAAIFHRFVRERIANWKL
jgi:hypothetical protein